jgi:hypothetical protein
MREKACTSLSTRGLKALKALKAHTFPRLHTGPSCSPLQNAAVLSPACLAVPHLARLMRALESEVLLLFVEHLRTLIDGAKFRKIPVIQIFHFEDSEPTTPPQARNHSNS